MSTFQCPLCGSENEVGSQRCQNCGADFSKFPGEFMPKEPEPEENTQESSTAEKKSSVSASDNNTKIPQWLKDKMDKKKDTSKNNTASFDSYINLIFGDTDKQDHSKISDNDSIPEISDSTEKGNDPQNNILPNEDEKSNQDFETFSQLHPARKWEDPDVPFDNNENNEPVENTSPSDDVRTDPVSETQKESEMPVSLEHTEDSSEISVSEPAKNEDEETDHTSEVISNSEIPSVSEEKATIPPVENEESKEESIEPILNTSHEENSTSEDNKKEENTPDEIEIEPSNEINQNDPEENNLSQNSTDQANDLPLTDESQEKESKPDQEKAKQTEQLPLTFEENNEKETTQTADKTIQPDSISEDLHNKISKIESIASMPKSKGRKKKSKKNEMKTLPDDSLLLDDDTSNEEKWDPDVEPSYELMNPVSARKVEDREILQPNTEIEETDKPDKTDIKQDNSVKDVLLSEEKENQEKAEVPEVLAEGTSTEEKTEPSSDKPAEPISSSNKVSDQSDDTFTPDKDSLIGTFLDTITQPDESENSTSHPNDNKDENHSAEISEISVEIINTEIEPSENSAEKPNIESTNGASSQIQESQETDNEILNSVLNEDTTPESSENNSEKPAEPVQVISEEEMKEIPWDLFASRSINEFGEEIPDSETHPNPSSQELPNSNFQKKMVYTIIGSLLQTEGKNRKMENLPARFQNKYVQIILSLIVLLGVIGILTTNITDQINLPAEDSDAAETAAAFTSLIDNIPSGSHVLLAADYSPAYGYELEPSMKTLISQLNNKSIKIDLASSNPASLPIIMDVVKEIKASDSVNYGYIPGGIAAIQMILRQKDFQPAAIILITSDYNNAVSWIEQRYWMMSTKPIGVIASAQLDEILKPYQDSGMISELLASPNSKDIFAVRKTDDSTEHRKLFARYFLVACLFFFYLAGKLFAGYDPHHKVSESNSEKGSHSTQTEAEK